MARDATCPAPNRVARLMVGDLPPDEADAIGDHVTECAECTSILRNLTEQPLLPLGGKSDIETWVGDPDDRVAIERLIDWWQARSQHTEPLDDPKSPSSLRADFPAPFVPVGGRETQDTLMALVEQLFGKSTTPDALGRLGPYRVLRLLGAGGMGVVFEAEDEHLGRRVALKAMHPSLRASDEHRLRFLREARAAASIDHDHIVPIHHVGEDRGVPYFTMPLLRGESLQERLRRAERLSIEEVVGLGAQIALGIGAAHARGLIHRDIKPGNIWLEDRGQATPRVRILDFGLVRHEDDDSQLTRSGSIAGTPAFMSPEQARGESIDARSDLFSLGCILYCALVGELPFTGRNSAAMLYATIHHQPTPPCAIDARVPAALSACVMRLLQKDPAKRVQSADEVVQSLTAVMNDLSTALPIRSAEQTVASAPTDARSLSRRSKRVAVLFAFLPLVVIAAWGVFHQRGRTRLPLEPVVPNSVAPRAAASGDASQVGPATVAGQIPPESAAPPNASSDVAFPGLLPAAARRAGIRRWQMETRAPRGDIFAIAWDHDGRRLACGSPIGNVRVIDVENKTTISVIPAHQGPVWALDWSPTEDKLAAAGEDGQVWLLDCQSQQRRPLGSHAGTARCIAFHPDGHWIASGGYDAKVRLWRVTGELGPVLGGHQSQIDAVAWHSSGKQLASASLDGTVRIWDLRSSWSADGISSTLVTGHLGGVLGLSWSADGQYLASAGVDGTVLISQRDGKQHAVLRGHTGAITAIRWSSSGILATGGDDQTVRLWQSDGTPLKTLKLEVGRINYLAWTRDGRRLAVATSNDGIRFLTDTGDGHGEIKPAVLSMRAVAWSGAGELATAGDTGFVGVWNSDGTQKKQLQGHSANAYSVAWSPQGDRLISAGWATGVQIWNAQGAALSSRSGTTPVAWNPRHDEYAWTVGSEIQLATQDGAARTLHGHAANVMRIVWNRTGTLLVSADVKGEVRIWNRDGAPGGLIATDPMVLALAWHPDKPLIASGSATSGKIQLWEVDGQRVAQWTAHSKGITALDWNPNGSRLLSSAYDQRMRVWDNSGQEMGELPGPMAIGCAAAWDATGQQIATAHIDGAIRFWDAATFAPKATCLVFSTGGWASFDKDGIARASDVATVARELIVMAEDDAGTFHQMTLAEFAERHPPLSTR